jgi:hypothetical protein
LLIIVKIKPTVASILRVNHESFKTDSNKLRKNEEKKPPKYISSVISKITIFCPYMHPRLFTVQRTFALLVALYQSVGNQKNDVTTESK